jgi:hypothetical protein
MVKEKTDIADEKPIYFTMKMSDEFIDLSIEEKKLLARTMIKETCNPRKLSKDDLRKLMITAKSKNSLESQ